MTTKTKQRFDVYEAVTHQIITAIEAGAGQVCYALAQERRSHHAPEEHLDG